MKLLITYIQRIMMLAFLVCTMEACSDKESSDDFEQEEIGAVSLRIAIGGPGNHSRAVPTGGEHGDGLEAGQHHENDINSLMLFAYKGSIGANASTPVKLVAYLTDLNLTPEQAKYVNGMYVHEVRVDDKFINGYNYTTNDQFVVVTNMSAFTASTLGELRDINVLKPVTKAALGEPISNAHSFVMSNERESSYTDGIGTAANPHIINVTIERITARVDLITGNADVDEDRKSLCYSANDGADDTKVGDVYVSHARVFNGMTAPSFLIKRLTQSENSAKYYLLDEAKPATSYVEEPNTWLKNTDDADKFSYWYGESHIFKARSMGDSWFRNADRVHIAAPSAGNDGFGTSTSVDEAGNKYYVLDYVNENTMTPENTRAEVTTGVMLKAVYKPVKVFKSLDADNQPVVDSEYTYGQTFWRYRPVTAAYDETKALYFSDEDAAIAYRNANPEVMAEISEYTDGKCYYPVYLRHDNTHGTPYVNMMEFGIVRNNIYRLRVSFTGPGYPTIEDFDLDPEGVSPYIFVRKWYKILHPEIEI